jgi:hypothetical protein
MIISQIALTPFLGFPAVMWGGIFTLTLFVTVAIIGMLGANKVPHKYHVWLARTALFFGVIHGILGASIFLKF